MRGTDFVYPKKVTYSCELCSHGVVEAQRKDGLPGAFLFRCKCSPDHPGRPKFYPLWTESTADKYKSIKQVKK